MQETGDFLQPMPGLAYRDGSPLPGIRDNYWLPKGDDLHKADIACDR
jgi:hypothetical protein